MKTKTVKYMDARIFKGLCGISAIAASVVASNNSVAQTTATVTPSSPTFLEAVQTASASKTGTRAGMIDSGPAFAQAYYTAKNQAEAAATILGTNSAYAQAVASVSWQFVVIAPKALSTTSVPIILQGSGQLTIELDNAPADQANDYAGFTLNSTAGFGTISQGLTLKGQDKFNFSPNAQVVPFTVYTITEQVFAYSIPVSGGTTDSVTALFDPTLFFPNGFDSDGYSIEVSPAPVPEPPSTLMMLAGLAGLGVFISQKRDSIRI